MSAGLVMLRSSEELSADMSASDELGISGSELDCSVRCATVLLSGRSRLVEVDSGFDS